MDNPASSGAQLFFTADKNFILKTATKKEVDYLLIKVLPQLITNMDAKRSTLIVEIIGVYSFNKNYHLIIMRNIFPGGSSNIVRKFDLKGSITNRRVSNSPINVHVQSYRKQTKRLDDFRFEDCQRNRRYSIRKFRQCIT